MADRSWLPRLDALRGNRVGVDIPGLESSRLRWNMRRDDLPRLSNLLAGCSICLNSGSTLSIDAIVHDRPVILTAFDAGKDLPWFLSARRVLDYRHLSKLVSLGGVRVAHGFDGLATSIRAYLDDPNLDTMGRSRTREAQCGPCDGRASARVAAALASILEADGGQPPGALRSNLP